VGYEIFLDRDQVTIEILNMVIEVVKDEASRLRTAVDSQPLKKKIEWP